MKKMKQKEIRYLIAIGVAKNLNDLEQGTKEVQEKASREMWRRVAYSSGVYGCNGVIIKSENGDVYAGVGRSYNVLYLGF